jgi:RND family efflux transporter MFP subunit
MQNGRIWNIYWIWCNKMQRHVGDVGHKQYTTVYEMGKGVLMSRKRLFKALMITPAVSAAILAAALGGCNRQVDETQGDVNYERILLPVRAAEVVHRDIAKKLLFSGTIDAHRRVAVAPASPGRVHRIYVHEGQRVGKDALLVKMDDYQLQQAAATLGQVEGDYQRIKALRDKGSATPQAYDQIKAAYDAAKASYNLLKSSVELRAPFTGTIIGKYLNEGEIYSSMPGASGTAAIVEIAQLYRMKIEVMVPEQEFIYLRPGQTALVRVDAYPDTLFEGKVHTVNPALNRMSRTSRVTIDIANSEKLLKPGMFAQVEIVTDVKKDALAVPSEALVRRDGNLLVFTVERSEPPYTTTPKAVSVTTGMMTDEFAEIVSGLDEGALVITENNASLLDSTGISVVGITTAAQE